MVLKASKATGPVKISGRRKDGIKGVHSELFEDAFDHLICQQATGMEETTSVMLRANSKTASSILSLLLAPSLFLL